MRKFLSIIFVFSLMLFLYSCGHNHEYKSTVVESTCIEQGYTEHTCSCGDSYKDNYTNFKEHSYGSWVEFDNIGREERSCIVCGNIETRTMECTLTYVDLEGNTIKTETYDWGSQVVFDEPYEVEGSKFLGWSIYNDSVEIYKNYLITKDMTVYPVSKKVYTVKFYNHHDELIETQEVLEGDSFITPSLSNEGNIVQELFYTYQLLQWDLLDVCVYSDLEVRPIVNKYPNSFHTEIILENQNDKLLDCINFYVPVFSNVDFEISDINEDLYIDGNKYAFKEWIVTLPISKEDTIKYKPIFSVEELEFDIAFPNEWNDAFYIEGLDGKLKYDDSVEDLTIYRFSENEMYVYKCSDINDVNYETLTITYGYDLIDYVEINGYYVALDNSLALIYTDDGTYAKTNSTEFTEIKVNHIYQDFYFIYDNKLYLCQNETSSSINVNVYDGYKNLDFISDSILIDKESNKAILIGYDEQKYIDSFVYECTYSLEDNVYIFTTKDNVTMFGKEIKINSDINASSEFVLILADNIDDAKKYTEIDTDSDNYQYKEDYILENFKSNFEYIIFDSSIFDRYEYEDITFYHIDEEYSDIVYYYHYYLDSVHNGYVTFDNACKFNDGSWILSLSDNKYLSNSDDIKKIIYSSYDYSNSSYSNVASYKKNSEHYLMLNDLQLEVKDVYKYEEKEYIITDKYLLEHYILTNSANLYAYESTLDGYLVTVEYSTGIQQTVYKFKEDELLIVPYAQDRYDEESSELVYELTDSIYTYKIYKDKNDVYKYISMSINHENTYYGDCLHFENDVYYLYNLRRDNSIASGVFIGDYNSVVEKTSYGVKILTGEEYAVLDDVLYKFNKLSSSTFVLSEVGGSKTVIKSSASKYYYDNFNTYNEEFNKCSLNIDGTNKIGYVSQNYIYFENDLNKLYSNGNVWYIYNHKNYETPMAFKRGVTSNGETIFILLNKVWDKHYPYESLYQSEFFMAGKTFGETYEEIPLVDTCYNTKVFQINEEDYIIDYKGIKYVYNNYDFIVEKVTFIKVFDKLDERFIYVQFDKELLVLEAVDGKLVELGRFENRHINNEKNIYYDSSYNGYLIENDTIKQVNSVEVIKNICNVSYILDDQTSIFINFDTLYVITNDSFVEYKLYLKPSEELYFTIININDEYKIIFIQSEVITVKDCINY